MRTFKLLVRDAGDPSLRILKYFDKHIISINNMGVMLTIARLEDQDLDKDMVDELASRGITRFPTLITDNQKLFVGTEKIRDLFDKSLQAFKRQNMGKAAPKVAGVGSPATEFGTNPELSAYWHKYMLEDKSEEGDDINESKKDIDRRMREYRPPSHRDSKKGNREVDMARMQQDRKGNGGIGGRPAQPNHRGPTRPTDDDDEDNIIVEPAGSSVVDTLSDVEHEENDPKDDLMERAMWENKGGGFDPGQ